METMSLNTLDWARMEFSEAQLGDVRRTQRLIGVAAGLAKRPQGALPQTFFDWAELKAAYRMLENEEVTYDKIIGPHRQRVRERCRQAGDYLLIEDTTELDFKTHTSTEGLGRVKATSGYGLFVHSTLACRVEGWNADQEPRVGLVGLFDQKPWVRTAKVHHRQPDKVRLARPRESQRWASIFAQTGGPPASVRWTYLADRESDIYEVFQKLQHESMDFIIRAARPRSLSDDEGSIFDRVSHIGISGRFKVDLRARPGQKARRAQLEVRACPVRLRGPWRPEGRPEPVAVNVVEIKEIHTPARIQGLHWFLLTSWPIETFEQALRVAHTYRHRWLIEEYHKALKTGTHVEDTQLKTAHRIEALLGILAVVGVRLLSAKWLAEQRPNEKPALEEFEPDIRKILELKIGRPREGWTYQTIWVAIARLGGFIGRRSDGQPGWLTLWRGWKQLSLLEEGYTLAKKGKKCG